MRTTFLLITLGLTGCGGAVDEDLQVRAAYQAYGTALKGRDLEALKSAVTRDRALELSAPEAPVLLELAAKMRPPEPTVLSSSITKGKAVLQVRGIQEGRAMTGTASLLKEEARWRVEKEDWSVEIRIEAPPEPSGDPVSASMPAAVRALVDRAASDNPETGAAAWIELGAKYQSAAAFRKDVSPALADERPAAFAIVEEKFSGNGSSFRYFTAKAVASGGRQPAGTVGEALRYHLWQLEDVSNRGFKGSFAEWWPGYAKSKGLPTGEGNR